MSKEAMKLAQELRALADRFSEGWHEGIKIDASDIVLLSDAAEALAEQPARQEPVAWMHPDGRVWTFGRGLDKSTFTIPLYTSPPAQRKPLTEEMVLAAARMLSDRQAAACNVDCGDMWKLHGNDFIDDARAALEAAHGIKEKT